MLEEIGGPELLDFINSDERYAQLGEPFLRQIWGELCKAVGWMHSVALVHRDIKLESRLFYPFSLAGDGLRLLQIFS